MHTTAGPGAFRRALVICSLLAVLAAALPSSVAVAVGPEGKRAVSADAGATKLTTGATIDARIAASGEVAVMVQLAGAPSAQAALAARRVRNDAAAAGRVQRARNDTAQRAVLARIRGRADVKVLYRVQAAFNGIAVVADRKALEQLARLPGVVSIRPLSTMDRGNANTQPLIGAPEVWESFGLTGTGISIAVIDTGIDYVHTMFGGPGTPTALADARSAANNPAVVGPAIPPPGFNVMSGGNQIYPSVKVAGGFDFAGDTYQADPATPNYQPVPNPDSNPEDCPSSLGGGHGSHVSGTAAGYGVNADGSAFAGPWDTSTPFDSMRVGPGVAPQATLYGLRVFGCTGSTNLTTQAIDWAVDPNRDGDPADHFDVINMSLGSSYGTPDDDSAAASDLAAAAGVIVVTSAGNAGDVTYVSGSPGSATRALAVASSVDTTDVVDGFGVDVPTPAVKEATFSVAFGWAASSPLTAPLVYLTGGNTTGCSAFTAGTVTGKVVLVDWAPAGTSTFPCGSVARANNANAGGAVGIIMASGQPFFDTAITGAATVRAVFTTFTVGSALKTSLAGGPVNITFDNAYRNGGKFVVAGADDTVSVFTSRGPRGRGNALKPDIAAPGQSIFSTDAGTGTHGKSLNGTSMAAPHMAGVMAILRQEHPSWTVEELKALAMNTADHDLWTGLNGTGTRYGPARVGSGRVDVPQAQASEVVAYNDAVSGAVSVSFGAVEVPAVTAVDKTIRVVNKGGSPASYTVSYDAITAVPGVSYSFPDGATVNVPPVSSATFRVRLNADPALMKNTRDATMLALQGGNPRHFLNEASGNVKLTPAAGGVLRVPVYAAVRPSSTMSVTQTAISFPAANGSMDLNLAGTGVATGAPGPNEHYSLVTALELQGISPELTTLPAGVDESARNADLRYISATATPSQVLFGLTTWNDHNTLASDIEFDIFVDRDRNGTDDLVVFSTRFTDTDVFVTVRQIGAAQSLNFTNVLSSSISTAAMNSDIILMPMNISGLGMPAGSTKFNYRIQSFSRFSGLVDAAGPFTFDYVNRGLDFNGGFTSPPIWDDQPGATVPVAYNNADYLANDSKGALLLHHYNTEGNRAEVVPVAAQVAMTAPASQVFGTSTFPVSATSSNGQAVTFSSQTPSVCSVAGTDVSTQSVGTCTIRGSTAATSNFASAHRDASIEIDPGDRHRHALGGLQPHAGRPAGDVHFGDRPVQRDRHRPVHGRGQQHRQPSGRRLGHGAADHVIAATRRSLDHRGLQR